VRLALSILLLGVVFAVPAVKLSDAVFEREAQDQTAGSRVGAEFVWPSSPIAANPERAFHILAEAADETGSNVIRTSVGTTDSGRTRITHYVYLEREDARLFGEFRLSEGRWLDRAESRTGSAIVSSAQTGAAKNVGTPSVFAEAYDLTFAPLHQAFDSLPTAGRYVVESPDDAGTDRFLGIVFQRLVETGMVDLTIEDLVADGFRTAPSSENSLQFVTYPLVAIAALLVASILLREGKRIGVMRLSGYSTARIWYRVVGRLQFIPILTGLLLCAAILFLIPGTDASFARNLALALLGVMAVSFGVTFVVGLIVINRTQVADLIKGGL
jgi:hypothetical protein